MRNIIFGLLFILINTAYSQYDYFFQQEYFFGNLPSAKTEAMGRADVAVGGSVNSIFFNPAGLGRIGEQEISFSTSAPFYVLGKSDYYFAAYGRRISPKLVAAISFNQLAVGPTSFGTRINGVRHDLDAPKSSNLALSAAYEVMDGLHLGLNANMFNWKLFDEVTAAKTLHFDLGVLYRKKLSTTEARSKHLQFGASVNNASASSITFASPAGDEATQDFPILARIGVAYLVKTELALPHAGAGPLDLTFTAEYQNTLNSDFRTGLMLGAEAVIWEVFALRLGYLSQSLRSGGFSNNRDQFTGFTHGFGLLIPLDKLSKGNFPFQVHLDHLSLKQPPYVYRGRRTPNMRSFGFRLTWLLEEQ